MSCNMTASAPKFIRLEGRVFNSWKRYKEKFGFEERTDSEFAARLLQIRLVGLSYYSHVKTGQISN